MNKVLSQISESYVLKSNCTASLNSISKDVQCAVKSLAIHKKYFLPSQTAYLQLY